MLIQEIIRKKRDKQVYINVELMPPDDTDIERALLFNKPDNIKEWLGIFG